ncbi:MAG: PIN domain-containing protein [Treponema sp.]|nr:PIN domain-containing protein [Spirochaetia bacterium]MDD7460304.1 PIN domain-containing protein [Spirochaetales bacterium]MDY5812531.1 PIN domain-containing protein [Treponema sp.]
MSECRYLIDSNIISEVIKNSPSMKVIEKLAEHSSDCCISVFTLHELLFGAERLEPGRRKSELLKFINEDVCENFPIVGYSSEAARIQAKMRSSLEKQGIILPYGDSQIAASAVCQNLIMVTRNKRHFEVLEKDFHLAIENWFE